MVISRTGFETRNIKKKQLRTHRKEEEHIEHTENNKVKTSVALPDSKDALKLWFEITKHELIEEIVVVPLQYLNTLQKRFERINNAGTGFTMSSTKT